jgi:hypothetical protein
VLASIDTTPALVDPRTAAIEVGSGGVHVEAVDSATVDSRYGSGALSVEIGMSEGGFSGSITVGVALAKSTVTDLVDARIRAATVHTTGDADVHATTTGTFTASAAVVAVGIAIQVSEVPISVQLTGIGLTSTNTYDGHTLATIDQASVVKADGDVTVTAGDTATMSSGIGAGGLSIGLISVDVVVIQSTNSIANTVGASISGSSVTSNSGDVTVWADATGDVTKTENGAVSVALGISGAGADQQGTGEINGSVTGSVGAGSTIKAGSGTVTTKGTSNSHVSVHLFGGSGSVIAGHVSTNKGTISRSTTAFVDQGASVTSDALEVFANATRMNIEANTELGAVGVAGGGTGDTVTATDSGDVQAYIGVAKGSTPTSAGTVIAVTHAATVHAVVSQAHVTATSDGGSGSVLIAVTLKSAEANITGSTCAYVGYLGASAPASFHAGTLTVDAEDDDVNATATILAVSVGLVGSGTGPKAGGDTTAKASITGAVEAFLAPNVAMTIDGMAKVTAGAASTAYGEAKGGSGALGIAISVLQADASTTLGTSASIAAGATLEAGGLVVSASTSLAKATDKVVVGEGAIVGGGAGAHGSTTASAGASAAIGDNANITVTGGGIRVHADGNDFASTDLLVATGNGIAGGRNADGKATVSPTISASIGANATVTATKATPPPTLGAGDPDFGEVEIEAVAFAEGDALAQSYGGALIGDGGGAHTTTNVNPQVLAYVGSSSTVTADGTVTVSASFTTPGTPPKADVLSVNGTLNTINVDPNLALRTGDLIQYSATSNSAILVTATNPTASLSNAGRLYNAIVLGSGALQLGLTFTGGQIDPLTDTIVFAGEHNFVEGDHVYVCQGACVGAALAAATAYYVHVVDAHTIKLRSSASAPATTTFNPKTVLAANLLTLAGFSEGEPVTYHAPPNVARQFGSLQVDVTVTISGGQPVLAGSNGKPTDTPSANNIFLPGACTTIGVLAVCLGHGLTTGERVRYEGTGIGGLTSGGDYSVLKINDFVVQLALAWDRVTGLRFDPHGGGDTISRTGGSWVAAGFKSGQTITVTGASDGANNGTFQIAAVSATVITLVEHGVLTCHHDNADPPNCIADPASVTITTNPTGISLVPTKPSDPKDDTLHTLTPLTDLPIGGLVDGQTYYVRTSGGKVGLSNASDGSLLALDGTGLDNPNHSLAREGVDLGVTVPFDVTANVSSSSITFYDADHEPVPHGFVEGEKVTYIGPSASRVFTSDQVDALFVPFPLPGSFVDVPTLDNIAIVGHGFVTGDRVRFTKLSGADIGGLTSATDYSVIRLDDNDIQLAVAADAVDHLEFARHATGDTITRTSGSWLAHGFAVGQTVTVSGAHGANNGTFTIHAVNDTVLTLDQALVVADGTENGTVSVATAAIALTPTKPGSSYSLTRLADLPIGGLTNGGTYYVRLDGTNPTTTFSLASMPGGAPLPLTTTGLSGFHFLRTEGLDLGTPTDVHTVVLDIEPAAGGTTGGLLQGPGGADLTKLLSAGGDGTSSSIAEGASGALVLGVSSPLANLTEKPVVQACLGWVATGTPACTGTTSSATATTVKAGGDVKVTASSSAKTDVYSDARAGGIIQVGVARGKGDYEPTTTAELGARSSVTAGGDVRVDATVDGELTVQVVVAGGGVIAVADTDSSGILNHTTTVTFGEVSTVTAGGHIDGKATSTLNGLVEATSFAAGGALWSSADANHDNISDYKPNGLEMVGNTITHVGQGAQLSGNTVSLFATFPKLYLAVHAGAESFVTLLVGVSSSYADAFAFLDVTAQTNIDTGTTRRTLVTGQNGVDIRATVQDLRFERQASRLAVGIIPPQSAVIGACDKDQAPSHDSGCQENGIGTSFTQHNAYAPTDAPTVKALVHVGKGVTVTAGGRAAGDPNLASFPTSRNPIALYVQSDVRTTKDLECGHPDTDFTASDCEWHLWTSFLPGSGGVGSFDYTLSHLSTSAPVEWDADVVVLGGLRGSPYLIVDGNGTVVAVNNVKVKGSSGSLVTPTVNQPVPTFGGDIVVGDITNDGYADIYMAADSGIDNKEYSSTKGDATQPWPTFEFRDTLDQVTIVNYSSHKLVIGKIDVVNTVFAGATPPPAGALPLVTLWPNCGDSAATCTGTTGFETSAKLEFNVQHASAPSYVDVEQRPASAFDLVLIALVNNPVGLTRLYDLTGLILGDGSEKVVTNLFDADAVAGSIGSAGPPASRLHVDLVKYFQRPFLLGPTVGGIRVPHIVANALDDAFLSLRGVDRTASVGELQLAIDRISATNGDVSLELRTAVRQPGQSATADVDVKVVDESSTNGWNGADGRPHSSHFRGTDSTTRSAYDPLRPGFDPSLDPALYPGAEVAVDGEVHLELVTVIPRTVEPLFELDHFAGTRALGEFTTVAPSGLPSGKAGVAAGPRSRSRTRRGSRTPPGS